MSEENKQLEAMENTPDVQSVKEEIRDFNKEVLGSPDSPLVVHKKGDASYEDTTENYEMNSTHNGEERPTLVRHRFKKEKKKSKAPIVVVLIIAVLAAVFAGLYYTGNISFGEKATTANTTEKTTEATTEDIVAKYKGTIVIKNTFIFVNGKEVKGIEGLQDALKYEDASPTAFELIVEDENTSFYNDEVLPLLTDLGFFTKETKVTHLDKTGLMAAAETTSVPPTTTTTTAPTTTAAPQTQPSTEQVSG